MTLMQMMWDSDAGQVLLEDGCYCSRRRSGDKTTISEILSVKKGAGVKMLKHLFDEGAKVLVARCPSNYASNRWYLRRGFTLIETSFTRSSKIPLNTWRLTRQELQETPS